MHSFSRNPLLFAQTAQRIGPTLMGLLLVLAAALLMSGCATGALEPAPPVDLPADVAATATPEPEPELIALDHIHGMGYSADGASLVVGTHTGLRIFADNRWFVADGPAHDYIAYTPTADGFYASGYPAPDAPDASPLGLFKSHDMGATIEKLGFDGEIEFHFLGAGYESNVVYLVNEKSTTTLEPGLFYTMDDGATWQAAAAQGVNWVTIQLAVHPTDPGILAFSSEGGVLLSTDNGDSFVLITDNAPRTAVTFSPAEIGVLYYGLHTLNRVGTDGAPPVAINTPLIDENDALNAIAVNPQNPDELAIATFNTFLWRTRDGGVSWQLLAAPPESAPARLD